MDFPTLTADILTGGETRKLPGQIYTQLLYERMRPFAPRIRNNIAQNYSDDEQ